MEPDLLQSMLGSATAGIISRIFTHPLDTAKARLQAQQIKSIKTQSVQTYHGPIDVLRKTARAEGMRGLYRGFGAIFVGGTPGTVIYLSGYEQAKKRLSSRNENQPQSRGMDFLVHFASGMLAETLACVIYVPVDVVKERLQVQRQDAKVKYYGSYDAMKTILRDEGLSGIYKGYAATLVSFGPFSAIYFGLYEIFKDGARIYTGNEVQTSRQSFDQAALTRKELEDLPFPWLMTCSASAGAIASWLTSPLDMAKLRLQLERGQSAATKTNSVGEAGLAYGGMANCLRQAYRDGGMRALFRGAGARVMHFTPATCITMTFYEKCTSFYARLLS